MMEDEAAILAWRFPRLWRRLADPNRFSLPHVLAPVLTRQATRFQLVMTVRAGAANRYAVLVAIDLITPVEAIRRTGGTAHPIAMFILDERIRLTLDLTMIVAFMAHSLVRLSGTS
jgi:hypothetical protein